MIQLGERFNNFIYSKRNLLIVISCFFALRLVVSILFIPEFNSVEDFTIAENIASGEGYKLFSDKGPTALKAPVYPLFLSIFILIFGSSAKLAVVIAQHLLISLVPLLMIELGRRLGRINYAFIAGWLFLLHPSYFYYPNVLETTNIFIPLLILTMIYFIRSYYSVNIKYVVIASLLSGILILTQPVVLLIIAGAIFIFIAKKKMKFGLIILLLTSIVLSPWIIRNYIQFEKIIPSKSPFYMNFYLGWLPEHHSNPKYDIISNKDKDEIDSLSRSGLNDVELEPYYKSMFLRYLAENPYLYLEKTIYQSSQFWYIPHRHSEDNSASFLFVRKIPVIILNILFALGIIIMLFKDPKPALTILILLGYFTIIYGLTHSANIRFKLDIEWIELFAVAAIFLRNGKTLSARPK